MHCDDIANGVGTCGLDPHLDCWLAEAQVVEGLERAVLGYLSLWLLQQRCTVQLACYALWGFAVFGACQHGCNLVRDLSASVAAWAHGHVTSTTRSTRC